MRPQPELQPAVGKRYLAGTHRALAPDETLQRVAPYLSQLGITRLANVTGLDVIGLPVVQAIRPNSRSVSVFQGKGVDLAAAKASAVMEAIETYYSEQADRPLWFGSAAELGGRRRIIDCSGLPPARERRFSRDLDLLWIAGEDLRTGDPVLVPYELVHTRYTIPWPPGSGCFLPSTNGLASGNNLMEAVVHALCELIERDAATLCELGGIDMASRRLDLRSVDDFHCRAAIARFAAAGLSVAAWDITTDIGVPAFWCQIMEHSSGPAMLALPADGHGCHPVRGIALLRALHEAAQSRLGVISGARDDVAPNLYVWRDDPALLTRHRRMIEHGATPRRFADIPERLSETFEADRDWLLERLARAGFSEAIIVDLSPRDGTPVAVVRAVVPGLEPLRYDGYQGGPRLRAVMARHS